MWSCASATPTPRLSKFAKAREVATFARARASRHFTESATPRSRSCGETLNSFLLPHGQCTSPRMTRKLTRRAVAWRFPAARRKLRGRASRQKSASRLGNAPPERKGETGEDEEEKKKSVSRRHAFGDAIPRAASFERAVLFSTSGR